MRTLAQAYLERGAPTQPMLHSEYKDIASMCHHVLLDALSPPDEKRLRRANDVVPILRQKAERFSFIQEPAMIVDNLVESGSLKGDVMRETAKLPVPCSWIEWPIDEPNTRYGILTVPGTLDFNEEQSRKFKMTIGNPDAIDANQTTFFVAAASTDEYCCPFGLLSLRSMELFARDRKHTPYCHWMIDGVSKERMEQALYLWFDYIDALFLLNTPRVSEIKQHKASDKLQRARIRSGKRPFLEYRQVNVVIGVASPTYRNARTQTAPLVREPGESDDTFERRRRKLHRVIPHFRTYRRDDGTARKVVPIDEQWRGDPKLGIIIHDRRVKPPTIK